MNPRGVPKGWLPPSTSSSSSLATTSSYDAVSAYYATQARNARHLALGVGLGLGLGGALLILGMTFWASRHYRIKRSQPAENAQHENPAYVNRQPASERPSRSGMRMELSESARYELSDYARPELSDPDRQELNGRDGRVELESDPKKLQSYEQQ